MSDNRPHQDLAVRVAAPFSLSKREKAIFRLLLEVDASNSLHQQYRVAGGWVRDKLLGMDSDDIDITLDRMSGKDFVSILQGHARAHPNSGIGRSYVVGQNVEKSKHLETAAVDLFGIQVEFVHLRSEVYADGSRVPEIRVGTPQQDAERRDLTINALFFDIAAGEIEDRVGGIEDLNAMLLRTPLDPTTTFLDDPLRVLRVLRFWSRYEESSLTDSIQEALGNPLLHDSLATKVSSERAGPEMIKLLAGAKPGRSLDALHTARLIEPIFGLSSAASLTEDHTAPSLVDAFRAHGSDSWIATAAAWFAGSEVSVQLHERASLAVLCLKRIGIGKSERERIARIVLGVQECEKDPLDQPRIARVVRRLGDDWWDAVRISGARRNDVNWSITTARCFRDYLSKDPILNPIINGDEIMRLLPSLDPRTGFIRALTESMLDAQARFSIRSERDAREYVLNRREELESEYGG